MSPNRKAELQRKLAMAPVPKPPAGLAERIKGDIPHPLKFDVIKERQRLSQSVAFNMRVAASILLLISSLYVVLHLMSRAERSESVAVPSVAVAQRAAAPQALQKSQSAPPPPPPAAVAETKKRADEENRPVTIVAAAKPMPMERARREEVLVAPAPPPASAPAAPPTVGGVAGGAVGGVRSESAPAIASNAEAAKARPVVKTEQAPAPDIAAAAPPPPRAMDIVASAQAKELELEPNTLFGLPAQRSAAPPRSLRIESSSEIKDGKTLLRIAIDAPDASPAAVDAKIEIDWRVPHDAVNAFSAATELAIPARASIAGVYAVAVPPDLSSRSIVAKVTLRYRSVKDGSEHSVTRTIRRRDLAAPDRQ